MNRILMHIILSIIALANMTSCQYDDKITAHILSHAESLLASNPQKAYALLDSIGYPENLNARQNAQWCMLMGEIADTIYTDLPYSHQLERAVHYYKHNGNTEEYARALLYLGRAYVEDRNYENAMHAYLKALNLSLSANNHNLAGYTDSYIGDLYYNQSSYDIALEKYLSAATHFKQANNKRSQAFAYRDAGRILCFEDSLNKALTFMQQASSILSQLKDSIGVADIFNGFGNIYAAKGDYSAAEYYFKKGIEYDKNESAPDYLALSQLSIQKGDIRQAKNWIEKAKQAEGNKHTYADCLYLHYEIEKSTGQINNALSYLEHYIELKDSIRNDKNQSDLSYIEKKYEHQKLINKNQRLTYQNTRLLLLSIIAVLCLTGAVAYFYLRRKAIIRRKNAELDRLASQLNDNKRLISRNNTYIAELETRIAENREATEQMEELQETLASLREENQTLHQNNERLQNEISTHKSTHKADSNAEELNLLKPHRDQLSALVLETHPYLVALHQKPVCLTDKERNRICQLTDTVYAGFGKRLLAAVPTLSEYEVLLCCLIKLHFSVSEIATLLAISPASVSTSKSRLKKKIYTHLGISSEKKSFDSWIWEL